MFIAVGAVAVIVISLSIFKKLFKAVLYIILLVVAVAVYVINTGEEPKALIDTAKTTVKDLEKDINKVKKAAASTVEKIDDAVPKDAKRSLNKVSKTLNKTLKENKKTVTGTVEKIDDAEPKDVKRSLNTVSKTVNKVLKEQKKAVMKLEKELKKHRKELGN